MSKIKKEDVEQISYLARLKTDEKDIKKYQSELSAILDYVDLINQADVSGVEPMANITGLVDISREDIRKPSDLTRNEVLSNVPEKKEGYIKVKPVLD